MFFLGTPGAYLPVGSENGVPVFPNFDAMKYYQYHLFIFSYYLLFALALMAATCYLARRDLFSRIISRMRPVQTVFFLGVVTAGIVLGWSSAGGMTYVTSVLSYPYWINMEFVIMALVAAFLGWQVTTLWNDVSDIDTDSPTRKDRLLAAGV